MSIASHLEAGTMLAGRRRRNRLNAIEELDAFLSETGIDLMPVDALQGGLALRAAFRTVVGWVTAARSTWPRLPLRVRQIADAPPLFVGEDFATADIARRLQSPDAN